MRLTTEFRQKYPNHNIIKVVQGDDNLIAELRKLRRGYKVSVYKKGYSTFRPIPHSSAYFANKNLADKYFKKVVEEF